MASLPKWLTRQKDGSFLVDPDVVYPEIFKALNVKKEDVDQHWIEVAYQCAKMKVQDLITGTELDPRPNNGFVIVIDGAADRKNRWALANHRPGVPGRDANSATRGLQAKGHYRRIMLHF